ncbi:MAG TPA: TIGR00266 family protein [Mycobacteriales bacterium]|nr:TIGR00266 family protein [Mycobacteriales bacterium]
MQHNIHGTTLQVLECVLGPGESVVGESGRMTWMSADVTMTTSTAYTGGSKGVWGAVKRAAGGATVFASNFQAGGAGGIVSFASSVPGQILPITIGPSEEYMVHTHGFVAGTPGIQLTTGFQQTLGMAFVGGEGFTLQKISGQAQAWIQLHGEIITYDLQAGQTLFVHPGHLGMFTGGVQMKITTIKGLKNKIFGGEFFLCQVTGPGKVWLQSLSLHTLAMDLAPYLPEQTAAAGGAGGVIGSLLKS